MQTGWASFFLWGSFFLRFLLGKQASTTHRQAYLALAGKELLRLVFLVLGRVRGFKNTRWLPQIKRPEKMKPDDSN